MNRSLILLLPLWWVFAPGCVSTRDAMVRQDFVPSSGVALVFGRMTQAFCPYSWAGNKLTVSGYSTATVYETETDAFGYFALALPVGHYEFYNVPFACKVPRPRGHWVLPQLAFEARPGAATYIGGIALGAIIDGHDAPIRVIDDFDGARLAFGTRFAHAGELTKGLAKFSKK